MARTHVHRPSAAALAALATLGLKSSRSMYGDSSSIVSSFILSFSNSWIFFRNCVSAMTVNANDQDGDRNSKVFLFTSSSLTTAGSILPMNSTSTPSNTRRMMSEGLGSFLTSLMCAGLMDSMAVLASSRKGCALARSASHCSFSPVMRCASASQPLLIFATFFDSFSASSDEISSEPNCLREARKQQLLVQMVCN